MAKKDRKASGKGKSVIETPAQENVTATETVQPENISDSQAENACVPGADQSELAVTPETATTRTGTRRSNPMKEVTATYKGTQKNGIQTFTVEALGASIYLNKSLLNGQPAKITVQIEDGDPATFAAAGAATATRGAVTAEKVQKAEEAQKKADERLQKQTERAKTLADKAARLKAALSGGTAADAAPVVEGQESQEAAQAGV